jgi:hypothetical protein
MKALISKVDASSIKVWQLLDMDKLPTWTRGKLVLVGDAAHPFTPRKLRQAHQSGTSSNIYKDQGQGAGQAIEDGVSLSVVLSRGILPEEVPERLKLYEKIRYERAHTIQDFSRRVGEDLVDGKPTINGEPDYVACSMALANQGVCLSVMQFNIYNFNHDEYDNSSNILKRWQWAKKPDVSWRMPIPFGPFPGSRQDASGAKRLADNRGTYTTATISFMTSRTLLDTILPTSQFTFQAPITTAMAKLVVTKFDEVTWLGGGGYTTIGLYLPGVQYTKKDGSIVKGTYLPVIFGNLPDSILSGREDLGLPKLFCDIDMKLDEAGSCKVSASWRGASFAELSIEGLKPDESKTEQKPTGEGGESGTLTYRYIPAVGEPGKADAEYACLIPREDAAKVQRKTVTHTASIKIDSRDEVTLPTLHHVTKFLAAMPVYKILSAQVVHGTGVAEAEGCMRIE